MNQFIEGFMLQVSLILALGAQNIFVLEAGLKNQKSLLVAAVCSICDMTLILVGVLGAASIFVKLPILKISFGVFGVLFMLYYGIKSFQKCFYSAPIKSSSTDSVNSVKKTILIALGFSLINPHVYLDTIVLIGGYAAKFNGLNERASFGLGAASFSTIWFFGLSLFAKRMSNTLNNPKSMQIISFVSGVILFFLSWKLGKDVYNWVNIEKVLL